MHRNDLKSRLRQFDGTLNSIYEEMAQNNAFEVMNHPIRDSFTASIKTSARNLREPLSATVSKKKGPQEVANFKMTNIVDATKAKIKIKHVIGGTRTTYQSIQSFTATTAGDRENVDRLVYRVGKQICVVDPENGSQQFFSGRHRSVSNVLHFSISPNQKHICMSEVVNQDSLSTDMAAQLSVYSLTNFTRVKTLSHPCQANFVSSTFCGDPKYIAALTDENDRQIVLWQWEKEKTCKAISINFPIIRLSSAPSTDIMLTSSGPGVLKSWFLGPDGTFRSTSILPTAKENENFIDHCWLPQGDQGSAVHRMVALTGYDSYSTAQKTPSFNHGVNDVSTSDNRTGMMMNGVGNSVCGSSSSSSSSFSSTQRSFLSSRMQNIFIFEGAGAPITNNNNLVAPAINLELKQVLHVRVDLSVHGGMMCSVCVCVIRFSLHDSTDYDGRLLTTEWTFVFHCKMYAMAC